MRRDREDGANRKNEQSRRQGKRPRSLRWAPGIHLPVRTVFARWRWESGMTSPSQSLAPADRQAPESQPAKTENPHRAPDRRRAMITVDTTVAVSSGDVGRVAPTGDWLRRRWRWAPVRRRQAGGADAGADHGSGAEGADPAIMTNSTLVLRRAQRLRAKAAPGRTRNMMFSTASAMSGVSFSSRTANGFGAWRSTSPAARATAMRRRSMRPRRRSGRRRRGAF
jgi:hypothetical protein